MNGLSAPGPLRDKLGEAGTEALTNMFELAAARYDRRLAEETGKLHLAIADLRFELIKWMFLFWIGQAAINMAALRFFA